MYKRHVCVCALCCDERRLHDWFTVARPICEKTAKNDDLSNADEHDHNCLAERPLQNPAVQSLGKRLALWLTQPVMCLVVNDGLEILVNDTRRQLHLQRDNHSSSLVWSYSSYIVKLIAPMRNMAVHCSQVVHSSSHPAYQFLPARRYAR